MTNGMDHGLGSADKKMVLRRFMLLRTTGFVLMAAGVAALAWTEAQGLGFAVATMALGALAAWSGALQRSRLEDRHDRRVARALRFLLAADGLKLMAIPTIALGGGWLAWGGPGFAAALAMAGLGSCAFAYGLVLRIDGVSMLPYKAPTWNA
jgi:hypothetical protein